MASETLTVSQVAEHYGLDSKDVIYAIRRGKIKGEKVGWVWTISKSDLPENWPVNKRNKSKQG